MSDPWLRPKTRFGLKVGAPQKDSPGKQSVAWAVLKSQPAAPLATGQSTLSPQALFDQLRNKECDGVTLYRYTTAAAYATSRAAREGMTWADHNRMIADTAAQFRAAGIDVQIENVNTQ